MRYGRTLIVSVATVAVACAAFFAVAAGAVQPGMTVKIPARQDVDRMYVLAAVHEKNSSLRVTGSVMGHRFKAFQKSKVTIHLTNQAFLRLSATSKRSVKRAIRRGRTVKAKVTVTGRNRSGSRNSVTRSVTLTD